MANPDKWTNHLVSSNDEKVSSANVITIIVVAYVLIAFPALVYFNLFNSEVSMFLLGIFGLAVTGQSVSKIRDTLGGRKRDY